MKNKFGILFILLTMIFLSCEKDITLKLPNSKAKIVVEGSIEQNSPPVVILTHTIGYFKPATESTLQNLFIHNATVTIQGNDSTFRLTELCSSDLPDSIIEEIAASSGINQQQLQQIDYCVYTTFDPNAFGKLNHRYNLTVQIKDTTLTATTTIPQLVPPDSLWFGSIPGNDSLGYLYFQLQDPPGRGNAWRVFTRRLHKDARFIPCLGSTFDDQYLDGKKLTLYFLRGSEFNSQAPDDKGEDAGYYRVGDTIAVKFCTIDEQSYKFWSTEEMAVSGSGNPFMSPVTVQTNIKGGGLGVWCGYAAAYDTVVAR